jgi:uncharacterized membrane protein
VSNLVAIAYPDVETARTVADELGELIKEESIELEDMVVVERTPEGKVKLRQSQKLTGRGAAGGAVWGMMIGFIFFAPFLGAAIGGATGAALGKQKDTGVEDDFMDRLGVQLSNGGAAVVVLVQRSTPEKVLPRISQYGGTVFQTSLDPDKESELQAALGGQGAAA